MPAEAYITDLDGTLLTSEQKLTDYTVQVITQALDQGALISYATARGYVSAARVVTQIPWRHPLILYNGALIYDGINGRVIDGYWLDPVISGKSSPLGGSWAAFARFIFHLMKRTVSVCCMNRL